MRPDSPLLDRVVHDANNLADPPQRRINMAMVDNGTRRLTVLNAVADETARCVGASEMRRWKRELARENIPSASKTKILIAVKAAAIDWFKNELIRPDGFLRRVSLSQNEDMRVKALAVEMPDDLFPGRDDLRRDIDREMVAEAVVTNRSLLLTEDEMTIKHVQINDWLSANRLTSSRDLFIQSNVTAHKRLEQDAGGRALYEWMLGAYLPDNPSGKDVQTIKYNAGQLELAGMRYASTRVLQELRTDPDPMATFENVRAELPNRARATEAERLRLTREAALDAGYTG